VQRCGGQQLRQQLVERPQHVSSRRRGRHGECLSTPAQSSFGKRDKHQEKGHGERRRNVPRRCVTCGPHDSPGRIRTFCLVTYLWLFSPLPSALASSAQCPVVRTRSSARVCSAPFCSLSLSSPSQAVQTARTSFQAPTMAQHPTGKASSLLSTPKTHGSRNGKGCQASSRESMQCGTKPQGLWKC
jgi:hypothetical protein